jgi:hypothetical protein
MKITKHQQAKQGRAKVVLKTKKNDLISLEGDFHNAVNMAAIAAQLLEDNLGRSHEDVTGHPEKYHLGAETVELILFAVYETHQKLKELRDRWYGA